MPIISIVVPVYKVEKYLERCVKSLMKQTLKDIEIILVDDGSPDRCGEICDQFMSQDSRIKVVHKENGGLSSARNAGMKVVQGKYIGFVDSDDDVSLDMFEVMVKAAEEYHADFVMSDYVRILENGQRIEATTKLENGFYDKDKIRREIFPSLIMGENIDYGPILSVCHCIYNRQFLNKNEITFAEDVKWSEDNLFSAIVGYCANNFVYLKRKYFYNYYQNPGTITTSYRKGAWLVYKAMNKHFHEFFDSIHDYDFTMQLKYHLIYYACNSIGQVPRSQESLHRQIRMIKEIMSDRSLQTAFKNLQFPATWPRKQKIQIGLIKYKMALFYRIFVLK